eukprot:TRINITY_DN15978_c0_g1_i1.p1 TRINITY_DN15978_c0_g1~~TRINITY_DN15978_c0_g1_i1.p1  ORF type:complete len:155 (-),score=23.73 TRINITY_DN15978_c0_g1_i1:177-641(-)
MVEPPGLFLGRGDHPKAGLWKKRIMPEDITLNLSECAPVPPCPLPGHNWGKVIHYPEVTWLATWTDNILNHQKYVLFAANSTIRGLSDRSKFEMARRLKLHINQIREQYTKELDDPDPFIMQRSTALWIIDHLALRVGNEKNEVRITTKMYATS